MKRALLAAVVALSIACASTGHDFNINAADSFEPGVTTIDQAMSVLGKPTGELNNTDGTKLVTWHFGRSTTLGSSSKVLTLQFGPDGKMLGVFQRLDG